jgi:signal transduction histidine kinase
VSRLLERVSSIKVKLGLLVVVSVTVAAVLATLGAGSVPPWLGIPVTVLLALAVTQLLALGMTAPLRQMTAAASRMSGGDYEVRVDTPSTDEVGELARAYNRMAADLATVDRQRRDLVATVSHELRTPLAGLVALLENIADGVTRPDSATVGVALAQAQRLGTLVEDLLDLSRADAGVVPLDRHTVGVSGLVDDVVREAASASRPVTFETRIPAQLQVEGDPRRLHQLLANLLDNASRHSPAGGVVRVSGGADDASVWLEVVDQGPGIPPEARERVFERYGTADGSTGGTGLGLAIARWVAELHGGRITALDPHTGATGARLRVELPMTNTAAESVRSAPMPTTPTAPAPARAASSPMPPPESTVDLLFGGLWPDRGVPARPVALLGCVAIGVLAGATLPLDPFGVATSLVLLASGAVVVAVGKRRDRPFTRACAGLCAALALVPTFRAAEWLSVLAVFLGAALMTVGIVGGRSVGGMVAGGLAWPMAGLRGVPWLGRTVRTISSRGRGTASTLVMLRTALLGLLAVLVFGALFASADAVFGHWVAGLVPELGPTPVLRLFVAVAVGGIVLAAAYLALNPPAVDPDRVVSASQHRFEWLAPVLLVDAVFTLFLAAQTAAFFGGHDYVQRTTGLTYADYVHQGFAQLTLATALTLVVVWAAARKARRDTPADRWWLRGALGLLCVLTLVVVGSALHRMALYQEAYGFTRLRLLVDLFEGWLGLVVLGVLVAGVRLRGDWLPRAAVLTGAALFLGLALVNPDAWIARHNLDRYHASGKVDWAYLRGLSEDAVPTILELPPAEAACAFPQQVRGAGSWTDWNLARARAVDALHDAGLATRTPCRLPSAGSG